MGFDAPSYTPMDLMLAMGIAWSLSGTFRLFAGARRRAPDTPYAVFVLLVFSFSILDNLFRPGDIRGVLPYGFYTLSRLSYYLVGPALWMYAQSVLKGGYRFRLASLAHFLPFLLWSAYVAFNPVFLLPEPQGPPPAEAFGSGSNPLLPTVPLLRNVTMNLLNLGYSGALIVRMHRHAREVPEFYSRKDLFTTLSWLLYLLYFYVVLFSANSVISLFPYPPGSLLRAFVESVRYGPSVLFVFFFAHFSFDQRPLTESGGAAEEEAREGGKYAKSGMLDSEISTLYAELESRMEKEKPYLDPDLNLASLAKRLGISRHQLSETINSRGGTKFYGYVNRFRLMEFKRAVDERKYPDMTILGIAFECGFRSSSAFYALFEKTFGLTPSKYMESLRRRSEQAS